MLPSLNPNPDHWRTMNAADTIAPVHEPSARRNAAYATAVDPSSVASGLAARERLLAPGELVSLWDVLETHAYNFIQLRDSLARLTELCESIREMPQSVTDPQLAESIKHHVEKFAEVLGNVLVQLQAMCDMLPLRVSLLRAERIRSTCARGLDSEDLEQLPGAVRDLVALIADELREIRFLYVPARRAEYWSETPLFSKKVQRHCRRAVDDMMEAGKCLAVDRSTACVFHLMRVVEVGAKRLATKTLGLTLSHKATLGTIITLIGREVAKMPTTTPKEMERKEEFSKMADHLNHIKDGWRNKTMHPGLRYDGEQAMLMFKNVCEFMQLLVDLK